MSNVKVFKFWAPWCGPCKVLAPEFDKAKDLAPEIEFEEVNVDEDTYGDAAAYGVMSVPTVLFLKDDEVVDRFVGFRPAEQIKEIADKYI